MKSASQDRKSAMFLFVILLIIIGVTVYLSISLKTNPIEETLKNSPVIESVWVINDGQGNALLTNVVVFYPAASTGAVFDILGNTGAIYSSLGRVDRIDAVYKEKGIQTYVGELEKLIGKSIPFYVEISLEKLQTLVDILYGLNVFVPYPVDEVSDDGEKWLLPSGGVKLDGDKIKTYISYSLPGESGRDIEDRREAVFIALLSAIHENRNLIFSKKNFSSYGSAFSSNMDSDNFFDFMKQISEIDVERISPQSITGSIRSVDGQSLLFPYYDGQLIKDIVNQTISSLINHDAGNQNRIYVLSIQNGTAEQGLARNTSFLLQSAGYDVIEATNADRNNYEKTQIINHIGNSEAANALGSFIHCSNIIEESLLPEDASATSAAKVDFTIILGRDFDGRFVKGGSSNTTNAN